MFPIVIGIISIAAASKWGDWKNWRSYLPTIQYLICGDLLYNFFASNFPLWRYPHPPNVLPNHLAVSLFIMFTIYPSSLLVYLYRYPKGNLLKQVGYLCLWIGLWLLFELYMITRGLCVYSHGWTYLWSVIFVCVMVPMLKLHHVRPLWAYLLSVPIIAFLLLWFHVPAFSAQ